MLLDLLSPDDNVTFNIKLAHLVGLNASIYCSELLNITKKAIKKKKIIGNGFIKLDRKYVFERTTLSNEQQLNSDLNLAKVGIIERDDSNSDIIKVNVELLVSLISETDLNIIEDIQKELKIKSPTYKKQTKQQAIANKIKNGIVCSDYELLTALREWVDTIFANPKGTYLTKSIVEKFQQTLNDYTKGDLDLALRLVNIATIQCYRDCQWAINIYEKDLQMTKRKLNSMSVRFNELEKATKESLSDEVF